MSKKCFKKRERCKCPARESYWMSFISSTASQVKSVSNDGEFIPGDSIQTQDNSLYNRLIVNLVATCPTCEICSFQSSSWPLQIGESVWGLTMGHGNVDAVWLQNPGNLAENTEVTDLLRTVLIWIRLNPSCLCDLMWFVSISLIHNWFIESKTNGENRWRPPWAASEHCVLSPLRKGWSPSRPRHRCVHPWPDIDTK